MQMVTVSDWRQSELSQWFAHNRHPSVYGVFYKDKHEKFCDYMGDIKREGRLTTDDYYSYIEYHARHKSSPTALAYVPDLFSLTGKRVPLPVMVEPTAYASFEDDTGTQRTTDRNDLYFLLKHHEFQHADDIYNGVTLRDGTRLNAENMKDAHRVYQEMLLESRAEMNEMRARLACSHQDSYWFIRNRKFIFGLLQQSSTMFEERAYQTSLEAQILIDVNKSLHELLPEIHGHEMFHYQRRRR